MNAVSIPTRDEWPRRALLCCALQLAGSVGIAGVLYAVGVARLGASGGMVALLAATICGLAALATLAVTAAAQGPQRGMVALAAGVFLLLGVPVVAGLVLTRSFAHLAEAGLFGWILAAYLANLVLETTLSVLLVRRQTLARKEM